MSTETLKRAASPAPRQAEGSSTRIRTKKQKGAKKAKAGSAGDEVLIKDIARMRKQAQPNTNVTPEKLVTFEVEVVCLNSTGDGLGLCGEYAVIVPFSLPGECVKAKPYFINEVDKIILCDMVEVLSKSSRRDDSLVQCKYFGKCSGCQFQQLPYAAQLEHKRQVVVHAYEDFCDLEPSLIPIVGETMASPLQYGYRTKITPHFDQPRKGFAPGQVPEIGFNEKGRRKVLDIEECPIATPALNRGLNAERKRVLGNLSAFKRGATLLLRETTMKSEEGLTHDYVTDSKKIITEIIGDKQFESPAGAFFQNNNSIMPRLTSYVREQLQSSAKYLIDAYCGSGLFSITCSEGLSAVNGVEISQDSIAWAKKNAEANNVNNAEFLAGSAELLFKQITFPAAETAMIVDPPRKGCDEVFLNQLLDYSPKVVVYVSCCVQTQARDVGFILGHDKGKDYVLESVRGFDLFPNTYHVESVAVLRKRPAA
ncbi:uracil-5--methyltransferase [Protomyces lactucae-debilis]|uniref:Uracil-5--methyltransferase n=1 Tax=Protomyces lactucae-debilis TaxID=2754530 RepID=A0A1Y2FRC1_PROLT|nr:uracil-5--methyltransferase [Protomyces lactucae-debilis]ORY85746.1 uracil-5--methyltransferase [Protomyces lactucae-debilis]